MYHEFLIPTNQSTRTSSCSKLPRCQYAHGLQWPHQGSSSRRLFEVIGLACQQQSWELIWSNMISWGSNDQIWCSWEKTMGGWKWAISTIDWRWDHWWFTGDWLLGPIFSGYWSTKFGCENAVLSHVDIVVVPSHRKWIGTITGIISGDSTWPPVTSTFHWRCHCSLLLHENGERSS